MSGGQEWVTHTPMTARFLNKLAKTESLMRSHFACADRKLMAHHRRCGAQLGELVALPGVPSSRLLDC